GGAFVGIDRLIKNRLNTRPIGFSKSKLDEAEENENFLKYMTAQDLKSFGLIPELIGRLPVLTHLDPLDKETLRRILLEPKNSIVKQYKRLFEMENITLTFDDGALEYIVEKAAEYKLGARGLRSICEGIMTDAMFELPSEEGQKELVITGEYAREKFDKSTLKQLRVA
ncbi:ATP-dependent Clp protease ATP-binding subunit ClpX, partial [Pontibacter ruber]